MTWLWIALGALALLIGLPLLIGALTAREHTASVTSRYRCSPDRVWAAITGFADMAGWRDGVSQVEILDPIAGKRRIREHTKFGPLTYELEEERPPERLVARIVDTDKGFGGTWTYEITPRADGAELRITERGFVDNLLFRFLSRYVFGYEGTMRGYQQSLRKKLEGAAH